MKNRIFNIKARQWTMFFALFVSAWLMGQVTNASYNFQSLTVGLIAGQDNWQYSGNLNLSNNLSGSANCGLPSAASPPDIVTTTTSGLYTGGRGLRHRGSGSTHGFTSRKNNAAWGYTVPATSDYLILEFDYDNNNYWGEFVHLGYDKNSDGNYNSNCNTPDADELGIGLSLTNAGMFLHKADGTTTSATRVGTGWTTYRITVDLRANGGQGAGSVCYRLLGSSGAWQQVAGLQGINMNINAASLNQNNLQRLDGIIVRQEAGGDGIVDNISISTYRDTVLKPVALCPGGTLNLSALTVPNTTVYQWNTPSGTTYTTSVASFTLTNIAANNHGTFTVTTNNCAVLSWTVPVTVYPTPTLTSVSSETICSGNSPNIVLTSTPVATYSWIATDNPNTTGESLSAQTSSVISNTILSSSSVVETVIYSVTPMSVPGNCAGAVQQVTVTLNPTPGPSSVSITASAYTICPGSTISFTATAVNGGSPPISQWQVNGVNAGTGAVFSSGSLNNNDVVSVILTSNLLCASSPTVASNTITVTLNPPTVPSVSIASSSSTICAGSSVGFTATPVNGGTSPTYQWQVNGVNAGNVSTFSSTVLNDQDIVSVILTSNALCASPTTANSNTITITVSSSLSPSVSIVSSGSVICAGTSLSFTATPVNGGPLPIYQWQVNGVNAGTGSVFTPTALNNQDVVSVLLTSNLSCASSFTAASNIITVTVNPLSVPSVSITSSGSAICAGANVSFTATPVNGGTAPAYQWQVNGVNAGTGPVLSSGSFSNNDIVSVVLTSNTLCASPATASSNTITLTVNPVSVSSVSIASSGSIICAGTSVSFTASAVNGGTTPSYQWQVNGVNAGIGPVFTSASLSQNDAVRVILTSNAPCAAPATANSNTISIIISPSLIPTVSIAVSSATLCEAAIASFTATSVNGGTMPSYQWQVNGVNAGTGVVFTSGSLSNNDMVSVILTSNALCASPVTAPSNTISMAIVRNVTPSVTLVSDANSICEGTLVSFTATAVNGGTSPVYQWQINGIGAGANFPVFGSSTLKNGDRITVTMVSNLPCVWAATVVSAPVTLSVTPIPVASFSYSPAQLTELAPDANFHNMSLNSTSWNWHFGNEGTSALQHPQYSFPAPGSYMVTLEAKNGDCSRSVSQIIRVERVSTYYIPNAFTPNSDGLNDRFGITGVGISGEHYEMRIFNRWGELLYKTSSPTEFWDGKSPDGTPVPPDVYVYSFEFELEGIAKEVITKVGHVTVLK